MTAAGLQSGPAAQILTIDVEAEIRKICGQQFSSPAERLVELVRTVVRYGARAVRVQVGLRWATIDTIGGSIPNDVIEYLSALGDARLESNQRHAALIACEAEHLVGLMALLGAGGAEIQTANGGGLLGLQLPAGARPIVTRGSETAPGIRIRVARRGQRRQEIAALRAACRFASLPIFLSGELVSAGMRTEDCLLEMTARSGQLECRVGLPRTGELCQTTILCQEVVSRESYSLSRRGFVHLAVVRDLGATSPDRIRPALVKSLVSAAREKLYTTLRESLPAMPLADRRVARNLLFRRCERSADLSHIEGLRLFRLLSGDVVDLGQLRAAARDGAIWAIDSSATRRPWLVPPAELFLLDAKERDFVVKQLGMRIMQPPLLTRDTLLSRGRRMLVAAGRSLRDGLRSISARVAGVQPLSHTMLVPVERQLIAALRAELASGRYVVPGLSRDVSREVRVFMSRRGSLPLRVRRTSGGLCLLVPRHHPQVIRVVTAFCREPASLYPSLAVLFGGHDGFGKRKAALQEALIASGAH
jgi:hypothetical protein